MIFSSIVIVNSLTNYDNKSLQVFDDKTKDTDDLIETTVINPEIPELPNNSDSDGSSDFLTPNVRNTYTPNFKIDSISSGFVVDYSLTITQFSDHMMSRIAQNDSIRFSISFSITEQARYDFYGSLYNSTSVNVASASNSEYYSPGTDHVATLDFSGFDIGKSMSIGYFNVSLSINKYNTSTYTILSNTMNVHHTDYYNYSWFISQPSFSGPFTFSTMDYDSNGLNDLLSMSASINTVFGGTFRVYYILYTSLGSQFFSSSKTYTISSGITPISIAISSWRLNIPSNYNGTYSLYMRIDLANSPNWLLTPEKNVSVSQNFNKFSWDVYPIIFANVNTFTEIDSDLNGKINNFELSINVFSRIIGSSSFYLYVYDNSTNAQLFYQYIPYNSLLKGNNSLFISINTLQFAKYGQNTSYYFNLESNFYDNYDPYSTWKTFNKIFTTSNYLYSQFETAGASLTNVFDSYGTDTDSDGLFNLISVDVQLLVNQIGTYRISSELRENGTNVYFTTNYAEQTFYSTGLKILTLNFDVWSVFNVKDRVWNDSLRLMYFYLYQMDPNSNNYINIYSNSSVIHSFSMNPNLFDPYPAYLTNIYSYNLLDLSGTSEFETLEFLTEIEIVESGQYYICSELLFINGISLGSMCGISTNFNTPGTYSFSLKFDIKAVSQFSVNQTLKISYINLYSQKYNHISGKSGNLLTIFDIDPSIIEQTEGSINNVVGMFPKDLDSNGKYDEIVFTINLTIRVFGDFRVTINLENNVSSSSTSGGSNKYFNSGFQQINVTFKSYNFLVSNSDSYTWIVSKIQLYFNNIFKSEINPGFQTIPLGLSNLDPKPISTAYDYSGSYINSDSETGFDYLLVSFKVNVSKDDYYYFSLSLSESINGNSRGSNSTKLHLTIGTNIIDIRFYNLAYYLDVNTIYRVSYISIYDYNIQNQNPGTQYYSYSVNINVGSSVSYSDFDKPDASFGNYLAFTPWSVNNEIVTINSTDYPVINYINVTVEVVISKLGNYYIEGYLYAEETNLNSYRTSVYIENYSPGIYNVSLSFDYNWFQDNVNNTIHIRNLYIRNQNTGQSYGSISNPILPEITPNTYIKEQFKNQYFDIISFVDYGVDNNGNNKFEYIKIDFNLSVKESFQYIQIDVYLGDLTKSGVHNYYSINYVNKGFFEFSILFNTAKLFSSEFELTNLIKSITIYGNLENGKYYNSQIGNNLPLRNNYYFSDLEIPAVNVLDANYEFVDLDGNSKFDVIRMEIIISSKFVMSLNIQFNTYSNPYSNGFGLNKNCYVYEGNNSIYFDFYAQKFQKINYSTFEINILDFRIYNTTYNWEEIYYKSTFFTIKIEDPNQFDYEILNIKSLEIQPVDLPTTDGKYDAFKFIFSIQSKINIKISIFLEYRDDSYNSIYLNFRLLVLPGMINYTVYSIKTSYDFQSFNLYVLNYISIDVYTGLEASNLFYLNSNEIPSDLNSEIQIDKTKWSDSYYYIENRPFDTIISGVYVSPYQTINLISGTKTQIDIVIKSSFEWVNFGYIYIQNSDISFKLNKLNSTHYSGFIDLIDIGPFSGGMVIEIVDLFGNMNSQYFNINISGDPNAPIVVDYNVYFPSTPIYEGEPFEISTFIMKKNNTIVSTTLLTGSSNLNLFISFNLQFIEDLSNETHAYFNGTVNLKNYNDNILRFKIAYKNQAGTSLLTTNDFVVDLSYAIIDDTLPTVDNLNYPQSVKINQKIYLNFTITDDRGIKDVVVQYKYQNLQTIVDLIPLSVTNTSMTSYNYAFSYTPNFAKSLDFFITITDTHDQVTKITKTIVVSDYNAPSVKSYSINPETIYFGDTVTITIIFKKESEVITSVSLSINGERSYAFEKSSENSFEETWTVSLKADKSGTFNYKVTALNTANKNTDVTFTVKVLNKASNNPLSTAPGFEVVFLIFSFVFLFSITKKIKKFSN
jgi:hypothetical protein